MLPYTAVDLLLAMYADLGTGAPSQPGAPPCARSRSPLERMMASWWRHLLRLGRPEGASV